MRSRRMGLDRGSSARFLTRTAQRCTRLGSSRRRTSRIVDGAFCSLATSSQSSSSSVEVAMARQPPAARAIATYSLASRSSVSSPDPPWLSLAKASQILSLSGFLRWARKVLLGTRFVRASVAARMTILFSENMRYSRAWMPLSSTRRLLASGPRDKRFVKARQASKWTSSKAPNWRQTQRRGLTADRACASVRVFGFVVTKIFARAWAAFVRHASVCVLSADAKATQALKPPCWMRVPLRSASLARLAKVSASFSAVFFDGGPDVARRAKREAPSARTTFRRRADASSSVSSSRSSSAFCLVTRINSSYCSGVISISFSRKCRRRSSSFVTVTLLKAQAIP
mmetsp:Transcript_1507/g.5172  ORF Transcript_1507/g.5172 Transcript_1507/m.5172 type:complete len:342 (+) Transcript_1507:3442-4467(+)